MKRNESCELSRYLNVSTWQAPYVLLRSAMFGEIIWGDDYEFSFVKHWFFFSLHSCKINAQTPLYGGHFNLVDNSKLPCYTLPPTQHHSFFRNLPPFSYLRRCCHLTSYVDGFAKQSKIITNGRLNRICLTQASLSFKRTDKSCTEQPKSFDPPPPPPRLAVLISTIQRLKLFLFCFFVHFPIGAPRKMYFREV